MPNRRDSTLIQIVTIGALGAAWLLARAAKDSRGKTTGRYNIRPGRYTALSTLLFIADLYAIPAVLRGKEIIQADEFAGLLPETIPWYDRAALGFDPHKRESYRRISDNVLRGIVASPLFLLADPRIRRDWKSVFTLYAWLHAVTYTIYSFSPLGPAFVDKYRPVVYYTGLTEIDRNTGNNRNARFSGHTANAASAAFFLARVYNDYHPQQATASKCCNYLFAGCAPLLLGWLRMKSLKHFASDVLQAIAIGACCGILVPALYRTADHVERH